MGKTLAFWFSIVLCICWLVLDMIANTGNFMHMGQDICAILSVIGLAVGIHIHLNLGLFSINTDDPGSLVTGMPQLPSKPAPVVPTLPAPPPLPDLTALLPQMVAAHASLSTTLANATAAAAAVPPAADPPAAPVTQSTDPTKPNYVPIRLT